MNVKIFLLTFLLFISFRNSASAQKQGQSRIDSLLVGTDSAKEDSNKVKLLVDLSFTYASIDPDEGIKYGKEALGLAKKLDWKKGIADANRTIGVNYSYGKSEYSTGLQYFLTSLKLFEELGNKSGTAKILSNIGVVYWYQSDFPKALEYYFKALHID